VRALSLLICSAAALGAIGASPAAAAPAPPPLTSGTMTWSLPTAPTTFLGAVLAAGGSATAGDGATAPAPLATPTTPSTAPAAPRTFTFPLGAAGTYDVATDTGTIGALGSLEFASPLEGFPISIVAPQLTLDLAPTGGTFAAKGMGVAGPLTLDGPTAPGVFHLDTTRATVDRSVGETRITGIVPAIAVRGTPFPDTYDVGAGPTTTPPAFGTIDLDIQFTIPATLTRLRGRTYTFSAGPYLKTLRTATAAATLATTPPTTEVLASGTLSRTGTATFTIPKGAPTLRDDSLYTLKIKGQHATTFGLTCPGRPGRSGDCRMR
jgi:hypothetical protein